MPYSFTPSFGSAVLAPCLQTLCAEIAASTVYRELTNLGEIGDTSHQAQGYSSDHNPFIIGPRQSAHPGAGYVRAIDLGGDPALLLQLRGELHAIYLRQDPRVYPYGYFKGPDSLITDWPPGTGFHTDTGDEGHLHVSMTQADGVHPSPAGWVRALDSRAPWGIGGAKPTPVTKPPVEDDDMPYMIQSTKPKSGIYLVSNNTKKPVHGTDAVRKYQAAGFAGPIPLDPGEVDSYPLVGK